MGFRDIHAFNLAMLAKQAWCLIYETHYLFYRVYKARYFPSCSFLDAELGANPSMVWWSLLQAWDVLREGSIWQVGNGQTIGINTHKWLPRSPNFKAGVDKNLKVADLIDTATQHWDRGKVHAIFEPDTREDIVKIKLNNVALRDKLIWKENKTNKFSVKTAYQVALRLHHPRTGEHSLASMDWKMRKRLWSLNIPPKVRNFMWRLASML